MLGILIIALLLVGVLILGWVLGRQGHDEGSACLWVCGGIFLFIFIIISVIVPASNFGRRAELVAFYEANSENYEMVATKTASYLSEEAFLESILVAGSIEKLKLTESISSRLLEWRDAVNDYNTNLTTMRHWDTNIFFGAYVPTVPDSLKLLVIK